jgi:hypothetical protein
MMLGVVVDEKSDHFPRFRAGPGKIPGITIMHSFNVYMINQLHPLIVFYCFPHFRARSLMSHTRHLRP